VTLVDQHVEEVDTTVDTDLVCLSFFTPQATSAYRIADDFRARGVKVLGGGIHPSVLPDETLEHCDAVVQGPVEGLWELILSDLGTGKLRRRYQGNPAAPFARPQRDLFRHSKYLKTDIVQISRGCHFDCDFCVVPAIGPCVVPRPIEEVLADIAGLGHRSFFFGDENMLFPDGESRDYRRELLAKMAERGLRKDAFTANYPHFLTALDESDCELLGAAGVRQIYLVAGLKRPLCQELPDPQVVRRIQQLRARGVHTFASFYLGNDGDSAPVESLIAEFCSATDTNIAEFIITTPYPGTQCFAKLDQAGRITDRQWEHYNGANVVFEPLHESREALLERYIALWRSFYEPITPAEMRRRYMRGFGRGVFGAGRRAATRANDR
ncbi:MAG: cobalamin-dependent protein, partial [Deltaproteobacteria bacterium]|nr:cobalamin-dependent protein [Deltaproteobacteria bacterium]